MVHALERAQELVTPGGALIVVHDRPLMPVVELHQDPKHKVVGWLQDEEGFPLLLQADEAVASYVRSSLLLVDDDDRRDFSYRTQIDSLEAFTEWVEKQWDTSYLPTQLEELIEKSFIEDERRTKVIVYREARVRKITVK
jgi:hypothetical protein